ncbi:DUF5686 and carboxypeptidase regulatory-like domain-containing protein [Pseudofulvibacter geojedonensis]|uniref:DUF5686 and carboxypeptidase regulatory-like domain-containing protein n=1 Tax=Pseudofulvibacter geojedonensis TaxID=1123758 RepID=A0ABW3I1J8_9FLAO
MKKNLVALSLLLVSFLTNAQITGVVTNNKQEVLPSVNVYLEDSYTGTTTNENGIYELVIDQERQYTVVFQYLGFKTIKKTIHITQFPYELNVVMSEQETSLDEISIEAKVDPGATIIKKTIQKQKQNISRVNQYTCDFYSKGIYGIKNAPKKIFGQDLDDFFVALDSTRSGIVYLSETISKIKFKAPNNFKEHMLASKVSGDDSGFSFNSASEFNLNFYHNTVNLDEAEVISPLAKFAFTYYKYQLEDLIYENGVAINKIKVTPKRPQERVFEGYVYIVEDQWQLYGVDLKVTGKQLQSLAFDQMLLKQNFRYNKENKFWVLLSQEMEFKFKFLKLKGDGRFTAVYSNYNFNPEFDRKTFNKEVLLVEKGANKKDSLYWGANRPMRLTSLEKNDYKVKDSIKVIRESKEYLDSIDRKNNKFKLGDLITSYTYNNTHKKWYWGVRSPLFAVQFNTVQGWYSNLNLFYGKRNKDKGSFTHISSKVDYGLSEEKFRLSGRFFKQFNSFSRPTLVVSGGRKLSQFNESEPISPLVNTVSTLFFEDNYAKFYDKTFAAATFGKEVINGLRVNIGASFEERKPVFNTTDYVTINEDDKVYTSNNPLDPFSSSAIINKHNITKVKLSASYRLGQEYSTYPDGKYNHNYYSETPLFLMSYERAIGASNNNYKFGLLKAGIRQNKSLSNKGKLRYSLTGGLFMKADGISFVDYKHFNGNQTHVSLREDLNSFNIMPYYTFSTNNNYAEIHVKHDFKGYVLGKLPLLNRLNFNLTIGSHIAFINNTKPYSEYSVGLNNIGWGKMRFLSVDFVKSFHNGQSESGFLFGVKLN